MVLGSRSTDLRAGLGGVDGRALRAGDVLFAGASQGPQVVRTVRAGGARGVEASAGAVVLRALPGPGAAGCAGMLDALLAADFVVDPLSDRMGVRLRLDGGGERAGARLAGGQVLSHGVTRGAVQLPPGGEPIVLLADAQTTGGYAVPAVVIGADLGRLAQLRPGERVRFARVTLDEALGALRERRQALAAAVSGDERVQGTTTMRQTDTEDVLARGFAEWSDAADLR
jgi:allophanate hydrolase subunit 2